MSNAADSGPILRIERGSSAHHPTVVGLHSHPEPMLLWSSSATLTATTPTRDWLVPPGYGLWVPGGVPHGGEVLHPGEGILLAFTPDDCPITWTEITGIRVDTLLGELIRHLDKSDPSTRNRSAAETLMFELLNPLPAQDLSIAMPTDPRLKHIADRLVANPADTRELAAWADFTHTSVRTLSRHFRAETGLSFAEWRTHIRIRAAIRELSTGTPVNATARAVGYRKPSAFIEAFRRVTGQTPGTYLR